MTGRLSAIAVICAIGLLQACTLVTPVPVTPAHNVYFGYDDVLGGRWALYVDPGEWDSLNGRVEGLGCSAQQFPVSIPFAQSVTDTLTNIVGEVTLIEAPLGTQALADRDLHGLILVRAEETDLELHLDWDPWTSPMEGVMKGEAEPAATILVDGLEGRLLGSRVQVDAYTELVGGDCTDLAAALGKATDDALEALMTRLGEELTDSRNVREYLQ